MDSHDSKLNTAEVRINELKNRTDSTHFLEYNRDRRDGKYKRELKQYRGQNENVQYTSNPSPRREDQRKDCYVPNL